MRRSLREHPRHFGSRPGRPFSSVHLPRSKARGPTSLSGFLRATLTFTSNCDNGSRRRDKVGGFLRGAIVAVGTPDETVSPSTDPLTEITLLRPPEGHNLYCGNDPAGDSVRYPLFV